MSDTSGSGGFGSAGGAIRTNLERSFGRRSRAAGARRAGGGSGTGRKPRNGDGDAGTVPDPDDPLAGIWTVLDEHELLVQSVAPPELLYYVKEMARFIDEAKRADLAGVVRRFDIRETAMFPSLRRVIKSRAPGNAESGADGSEQHSRAGGAFNAGSTRWAESLSGVADPTQVAVRGLVDTIRTGDAYDRALKLSARLILEEYVERVLRAFIRADDPWAAKATARLVADAHTQLDEFFARYPATDAWMTGRIAATLATFPGFLLRK